MPRGYRKDGTKIIPPHFGHKGFKHSEEVRRKISEKVSKSLIGNLRTLGYKQSPETIKKRLESRKDYRHSEETKKKISESGKKNNARYWLGKKRFISEESKEKLRKQAFKRGGIPWNKNKKRPEMSGSNHPQWKGGVTQINEHIRKSLEYKLWRKVVFKRDNYTCIWCGNNKSGNLNADHIKPFALYPELRFAIDNGRTLCIECHKKTPSYLNPFYKINPLRG